ncbi:hypothetical protein [Staphylococcus gallinarum]|uniref:hypothetical protein n=1 Tax=Staphylococcus gallinarum TaxID=1293 RepID=UPI003BAD3FFA
MSVPAPVYVCVCDVVAAAAANVDTLVVANLLNVLNCVGAVLVDSDVDVDKVIAFDPKSSDVLKLLVLLSSLVVDFSELVLPSLSDVDVSLSLSDLSDVDVSLSLSDLSDVDVSLSLSDSSDVDVSLSLSTFSDVDASLSDVSDVDASLSLVSDLLIAVDV